MALLNRYGLQQWWVTFFTMTAIVVLTLIPESLQEVLYLKHDPIRQGEWWRLLTCHLVHLSDNHTLFNFVGYVIVAFSFRDEISPRREIITLLITMSGVGLGIFYLNPEMYSYVGLSGAIYGVMVTYAIVGLHRMPLISWGFLAFIVVKFIIEEITGSTNPATEKFIGGKIAKNSHLYGALAGIIPGIVFYYQDKVKLLREDTDRFVNQFTQPIVRDLAWALHSPPLVSMKETDYCTINHDQCIEIANDFLPQLKTLDQNPEPLIAAVNPEEKRLGWYFEALLTYWLEHQDRYQLLAHGLTVFRDKTTLGEFDFIIWDKASQQTQHWEAAVKFYLGTKDFSQTKLWHGPGKKDRLDIKLTHLTEKQIRLSETDEAKALLAEKNMQIDTRQLYVKGRLFYPKAAKRQAKELSGLISSNHQKGRWYKVGDVIAMKSPTELGFHFWQRPLFHIANRDEWLTSHQSSQPANQQLDFPALLNTLANKTIDRPVVIIGNIRQQEYLRFFLVADDWDEGL